MRRRADREQRGSYHYADVVNHAAEQQQHQRKPEPVRKREQNPADAEDRDANEQGRTGVTQSAVDKQERNENRPRRWRRAQNSQSLRTNVKNLRRENREQRGRPTEQHGKQVEELCPQQLRLLH